MRGQPTGAVWLCFQRPYFLYHRKLLGELSRVAARTVTSFIAIRNRSLPPRNAPVQVPSRVTRLVPLFPFNLLNYGFGLTKVRFTTYILWSWLCMLPGTILYVVGSDALFTTMREGEIPWVLLGALAVVVALTFFIVRTARRRLEQAEADSAESHAPTQASEV